MTLGLNLPFDAEGNAQLLVDGTLAVNVSRNDEEGRLTLAAPVAQELRARPCSGRTSARRS